MAEEKNIRIVLDADVLIHFSKGGMLNVLPTIFPENEFILLEAVAEELKGDVGIQVDNLFLIRKNFIRLPFNPRGEMLREYARLKSRFGKGESACMAYCLFNHDVIGSSNLRDIRAYCEENRITYLTTLDFLWHGWKRGLVTTVEANAFIDEVRASGSKLPDVRIEKYECTHVINNQDN